MIEVRQIGIQSYRLTQNRAAPGYLPCPVVLGGLGKPPATRPANWNVAGCGSPNGGGSLYRLTEVRYGRCSADLQVGTLLKTKCAGLKPSATTPGDELGLRRPVKSTANDFFWNKATDLVENKGSR